jgi:WW domain-binding protein 2
MTFKDGGAFDFHSTYERIKERLQQAVDVARESGHLVGNGLEPGDGRGAGGLAGVNMDAVHLEELPTYDDANAGVPFLSPPAAMVPPNDSSIRNTDAVSDRRPQDSGSPPSEPPPEYEDVQRDSVADELERRLRRWSQIYDRNIGRFTHELGLFFWTAHSMEFSRQRLFGGSLLSGRSILYSGKTMMLGVWL